MEFYYQPSIQSILRELKKQAKSEMITSPEAYEDLVNDLINEKIEWGELDLNEDIKQIKDELISRWPEVDEYVRKGSLERP